MFDLDSTAYMIVTAVCATLGYLSIHRFKVGAFDKTPAFSGAITVFLGALAIPAGVELLVASLRGDPAKLPSNWRTYLGLGGVIAMAIALDKVVSTFKILLERSKADVAAKEEQGGTPNLTVSRVDANLPASSKGQETGSRS